MAMTEIPINEKNMAVFNAILEEGFLYIDDDYQPMNINQVVLFLLGVADQEGYLKKKASELYNKLQEEFRFPIK